MNLDTDQLFLMECFINSVKINYSKLPIFQNNTKYVSQTIICCQCLQYARIDIKEDKYTEKSSENCTVFKKGASYLFGLQGQKLLHYCNNLAVTLEVSDKIQNSGQVVFIGKKHINMNFAGADLSEGADEVRKEEKGVKNFDILDASGGLLVHIKGFVRFTSLGSRVITSFYFSDYMKDVLFRGEGFCESFVFHQDNNSQSQILKQNYENSQAQYEGQRKSSTRKNKPTGAEDLLNNFLNSLLEAENVGRGSIKDICTENNNLKEAQNERGAPQTKNDGVHIKEKDAELKATTAKASSADSALVTAPEESRADLDSIISCDCMPNRKEDIHQSKFESSSLSEFSCKCEAKPSVVKSPISNGQKQTETDQESSCECQEGRDESYNPPENNISTHSCPCALKDKQLVNYYSCVCMNGVERTNLLNNKQSKNKVNNLSDLYSCECLAKIEMKENKVHKLKSDADFYSCLCMKQNEITQDIPSLHSCLCTVKTTEPMVITTHLESNQYSCPCLLSKTNQTVKPLTFFPNGYTYPLNKGDINGSYFTLDPRLLYSCPCMMHENIVNLNDLEDNRTHYCTCMCKVERQIKSSPKLEESLCSCKCTQQSELPPKMKHKNELPAKESQVCLYKCGCKQNNKTAGLKEQSNNSSAHRSKLYHDAVYDNSKSILNDSLESKIRDILYDDYNIFIPERTIKSKQTPGILIRKIEPEPNGRIRLLESTSNNAYHKQTTKDSPFDSKTDIYLVKIRNNKDRKNQSKKLESGAKAEKQSSEMKKKNVASKNQKFENISKQTQPTQRKDDLAKISMKNSLEKKSQPVKVR